MDVSVVVYCSDEKYCGGVIDQPKTKKEKLDTGFNQAKKCVYRTKTIDSLTMSKMSKNKLNLTLPPGSVDASPIVPTPPFKTPSGTE